MQLGDRVVSVSWINYYDSMQRKVSPPMVVSGIVGPERIYCRNHEGDELEFQLWELEYAEETI